ncbi:MAG: SlyX family protein [Gammaproteobacteria bacterium]
MTDNTLKARVESLEARLMYQEAALEELTTTILRQEQIIQQQSGAIEQLEKLLRALGAANMASTGEETPPPHY